jgi:pyrroline-5-carboxylate reductase
MRPKPATGNKFNEKSRSNVMFYMSFIGTGNMGGALARAAAQRVPGDKILLANRTPAKAQALAQELGCAVGTPEQAAEAAYIFLGVKPKDMAQCLAQIAPILAQRKTGFTLVSMAAGLDTAAIQSMAGGQYPVVRLCPNTPVSIGQGLVAWCAKDADPAATQALVADMAGAGLWEACPEALMDTASVLGGCTPAFVYMFIEALADGAVQTGMPRAQALRYAAKAVEGAAALCGQSGQHPGALKDAVCSPGGSTIEGVLSLEKNGFRAAASQAIITAVEKTKRMGK